MRKQIERYLPTPQEIENKIREIQSGWSEKERDQRLVLPRIRLGIRIVSPSPEVSLREATIERSLSGWHYFETHELKERKKPFKASTEVPQEEVVERETYQPCIVDFGF